MTFGLAPGKLGFKLGEVLVGLKSGTQDVPETIASDQNKLHVIGYVWNPDTLAYEVATPSSTGGPYSLQLDEASATVTYVGEAAAGSATSAAAWRIKKLTTTGADLAITWAGGSTAFDKVWNDRLTESYS